MRFAVLLLCALPTYRLSAQVGHDPGTSPYRDIWSKQTVTLRFGYMAGSGGKFGVGPADGTALGLGYDISLGGAAQFNLGIMRATAQRFITDSLTVDTVGTRVDTIQHRRGPFDMDLLTVDVQLALSLTGAKSWHRLAPYAGIGVGYTFRLGGTLQEPDSTGFSFGTKFTLTPTIGTKVILSRHFVVRLELRDQLWRLRYPLSYTANRGGNTVAFLRPTDNSSEWTHHPLVSLGVGWTF